MTREEYPALEAWRRDQILRPMLPAKICVWTETFVELADDLAPGIIVEVECPDCEGRGYVDYAYEPGPFIDFGSDMRRDGLLVACRPWRDDDFFDRLQNDGLLTGKTPKLMSTFKVETRAVARHTDADGTTTERRWCTCYDDPASVLGHRTHSLADLIRAYIKLEPWAADELFVLVERLQDQGVRWGLWLAHWMVPARPGRPPRSQRRPSHPARKELEQELAMVARWAGEERRRASDRRWATLGTNEIYDELRRQSDGVEAAASLLAAGGIATQREAESAIVRAVRRIVEPTQTAAQSAARLGVNLAEYQRRWMEDGDRVTIPRARRWQTDYGGVMVTQPEPLMYLDDLVGPPPAEPPARLRGRQGYAILDDLAYQAPVEPTREGVVRLPEGEFIEGEFTVHELEAVVADPPDIAPEPPRQRQGPPIGDRLARRLRRGRPR